MTRPLRLAWSWGPLALYAATIFVLSSMSHPPMPGWSFPQQDKVAHLIEYGGLGLLLCRAFSGGRLSPRGALVAALAVGALYGASDELHQLFVPHRSADLMDLAVDCLGVSLGAAAYRAAVP